MTRAVFLDRDGVINGMRWDAEHGVVGPQLPPTISIIT